MLNWKIALIIAFIGVALALIPVTIYIQAGIGSPLQHQFDTMIPVIPLHLLTAIIGAGISIGGILMFVKSWRAFVEQQAFHRPSPPPIVSGPRMVGEEIDERTPFIEGSGGEVERLERELNEIIMHDTSTTDRGGEDTEPMQTIHQTNVGVSEQIPTHSVSDRVIEEPETGVGVVVVVQGVDEVCRSCGAVNPLGAKVCNECGEKMYIPKPDEPACPVCGAPLSEAQQIGENYICQVCFSELRLEKSLR